MMKVAVPSDITSMITGGRRGASCGKSSPKDEPTIQQDRQARTTAITKQTGTEEARCENAVICQIFELVEPVGVVVLTLALK